MAPAKVDFGAIWGDMCSILFSRFRWKNRTARWLLQFQAVFEIDPTPHILMLSSPSRDHYLQDNHKHLSVSKNSGTPKSWILRVFHYKPSILGYPYFWKHPFMVVPVPPSQCEAFPFKNLKLDEFFSDSPNRHTTLTLSPKQHIKKTKTSNFSTHVSHKHLPPPKKILKTRYPRHFSNLLLFDLGILVMAKLRRPLDALVIHMALWFLKLRHLRLEPEIFIDIFKWYAGFFRHGSHRF